MKKILKRSLMAVACLSCACAAGIGGMAINAQAETLGVADNFYMTDGAAIRIKGGKTPSGMRWEINVTEGYYNQITENGTKEVAFGTLVDDTAIVSVEENATEVNIPCTATPNFVDGVWSYYASITYDELAETLAGEGYNYTEEQIAQTLALVYEETLYARGYAVVDGEYVYAETADVARSIKGIAMNCLIEENTVGNEDVTTDNKADFEAYAGGAYTVIKNDGVTKNAYNVKTGMGVVTSQNDLKAGAYSVYVGAKKFDDVTLAEDGKVAATIAGLGAKASVVGEENNVRFVNAEGEVYEVPFVSATHTISTKEEFGSFLSSYDIASPTAEQVADQKTWYAVFTNDIVLSETWSWERQATSWFYGTLDGLGYMVKGPMWGCGYYGLFGRINAVATVKNIGFDNLTGHGYEGTGHWVLCDYLQGTMENIYVKGAQAKATQYIRLQNGVIKNCIFDVTTANDTQDYPLYNDWGTNTNNFSIGAVASGDITTNYATVGEFMTAQASNACWNGYWSFNDFGLCFGDTLVAQYATETKARAYGAAYTYANKAYTKQDTFTVDVSALIGEATDYTVLLDGEEIQTNGVITLNVADYTMASTHEVTVAVNGKVYTQPFMVVSHAIGTADEFKAYINSYTDNGGITVDWYAVLTDNITFIEEWVTGKAANNNNFFSGTFDGLGHMITGPIKVNQRYGLFGGIGGVAGTIKNVGFDGIESTYDYPFALSGYMAGTMENVYVKATTAIQSQYVNVQWNGSTSSNGVIKNCVFDITYTGTVGTVTNNKSANAFVIGNDANANYGTVAEFISAQLANVTAANGWNMDVWSVQNGNLYFGSALVG